MRLCRDVGTDRITTRVSLCVRHGCSVTDYRELLALDNGALSHVDPLLVNLLVAKSIPALSHLNIQAYQRRANYWGEQIRARLPNLEREFHDSPHEWKNDIRFFRLGVVCGFVEHDLGVAYHEDQRTATQILYTNPADLFLNGVMDERRGTCGNMAALHFALGWRMGWPVSLACAGSHYLLRFDDGQVSHNIEATQAGYGGFKSDPDDELMRNFQLPPIAVQCGSDLRALTAREVLGAFIGLRARHMRDTGRLTEALSDYTLARWLYPSSRRLYIDAMLLTLKQSWSLFVNGETGSARSVFNLLLEQYGTQWGFGHMMHDRLLGMALSGRGPQG
jgi:hypothetical protein